MGQSIEPSAAQNPAVNSRHSRFITAPHWSANTLLRVATLRELSAEIVKGGIEHAKGNIDRLEYAMLINSWIATAEETVAADRNVSPIVARRGSAYTVK